MRVADYIIERLAQMGVDRVFMVSGRGALYLTDAVARCPAVDAVCMHHEQAAAFAAVAYATLRRSVSVCMVSSGCAATNAMTGLLSAWQDGVPCLFISGQNTLKETTRHTGIKLRTYGQQEADVITLVESLCKLSCMVTHPQEVPEVLERALTVARSGRMGPVWIDIPLDIQSSTVEPIAHHAQTIEADPKDCADSEFEAFLARLRSASRPVLLIGSGIRAASAEMNLAKLVSSWQIPLTFSASAPDVYGAAHPLSIGSVGAMGCSRAGNFAVQNSDLVLAIGTRLNSLTTGSDLKKFARAANVIVVDIDPVEHQKESVKIDQFIHCDANKFINRILKEQPEAPRVEWVEKCQHWKKIFSVAEPAFQSDGQVDLYDLSAALSEVMPSPGVLVTDSGLAEVIIPSNVRFKEGVQCVHPASQGAMGFALPAAVGAALATNHPTVAIIGDGSIMMNLQEMETIRHLKLPIKVLVIANNVYAIIRRRQNELFRGRTVGTDPGNGVSCPDFSRVADCFGWTYCQINSPRGLKEAVAAVLAIPGPVLCEVQGRADQGYIEVAHAKSSLTKRWVKRPLEDQAPFLDRDLFLKEMMVDPIDQ